MNEAERRKEVGRWLQYARDDLAVAEELSALEPQRHRHICWLSQQAAEKAMKAVLVFLQIPFPFTHDLDALRDLIPPDWVLASEHRDLADLAEWAVESRYPGSWPEPTFLDAESALSQARGLVASVVRDLEEHGLRG